MKKIILLMTILLSAVGMQARVYHMEAHHGPHHSVVCKRVVNNNHAVKVYKVKHTRRGWRNHHPIPAKRTVCVRRTVHY